ncbi:hypothetical protein BDV25DRAFT_159900 [Aspergillus avenaceus]|uniref:Uncharacterized protein n=1 Tax=Aspergillus avenaceus TaxID=36643 RepID=A0A5N6TMQ1_ASPAV|nr:hypothetical protein BDV25DRAFT_159900 [Aspergillus avenaceus]
MSYAILLILRTFCFLVLVKVACGHSAICSFWCFYDMGGVSAGFQNVQFSER